MDVLLNWLSEQNYEYEGVDNSTIKSRSVFIKKYTKDINELKINSFMFSMMNIITTGISSEQLSRNIKKLMLELK